MSEISTYPVYNSRRIPVGERFLAAIRAPAIKFCGQSAKRRRREARALRGPRAISLPPNDGRVIREAARKITRRGRRTHRNVGQPYIHAQEAAQLRIRELAAAHARSSPPQLHLRFLAARGYGNVAARIYGHWQKYGARGNLSTLVAFDGI